MSETNSAPKAATARHTPGPWRVGYWIGRCSIESHGFRHPGPPECIYEPELQAHRVGSSPLGIAAAEPNKMVVDTHYDELCISEADAHLIAAAPEMYEALKECLSGLADMEPKLEERIEAAIAKAEGRS